jgi:hypothetical protein
LIFSNYKISLTQAETEDLKKIIRLQKIFIK